MLLYRKWHIQITNNHSTISVEKKQQSEENYIIAFNTLRIYITIYHTYSLLYCKWHIQITSNQSTISMERKKIEWQNAFNTLRSYITIYHTYILLYCKRHIQITSNHSIISVQRKKIKLQNCIQYTWNLHYNISHLLAIIL